MPDYGVRATGQLYRGHSWCRHGGAETCWPKRRPGTTSRRRMKKRSWQPFWSKSELCGAASGNCGAHTHTHTFWTSGPVFAGHPRSTCCRPPQSRAHAHSDRRGRSGPQEKRIPLWTLHFRPPLVSKSWAPRISAVASAPNSAWLARQLPEFGPDSAESRPSGGPNWGREVGPDPSNTQIRGQIQHDVDRCGRS